MEYLKIILLAVVQGLTEFLPVSSSGHLVILGDLLGMNVESSLSMEIMLHAGSLVAIVVFYFKLLLGFFRKDQLRLMGMVILGSVPAGVAGVAIKLSHSDALLEDPLITGFAFLVTGALLRLSGKEKLVAAAGTPVPLKKITIRQTLTVGFAQMFAILPGLSRSGSTITAGILSGVERESAAAFSFLLALPAIGGAVLLELKDMFKSASIDGGFQVSQMGVAVLVSALTSLGALTFLVRLVKKGKLDRFAWYLFALGVLVILWQVKVRLGR